MNKKHLLYLNYNDEYNDEKKKICSTEISHLFPTLHATFIESFECKLV